MDIQIIKTVVSKRNVTVKQLKKATVDYTGFRHANTVKESHLVLSKLIREFRWDLFESYSGYKIIHNGYGHFKEVRIGDKIYNKELIFSKLEKIENTYKKQLDIII